MTKILILISVFLSVSAWSATQTPHHVSNLTNEPLDLEVMGGVDGGGLDSEGPQGSAWFANPDRTVNYCQIVSSDFGISSEVTQEILRKAFQRWKTFLSSLRNDEKGNPYNLIAINFAETNCSNADLKFFFGHENADVIEDLAKLNNPLAFASRKSPAEEEWGHGYVWFQKSVFQIPWSQDLLWQKHLRLEVLALHEIGHVLGFGHVPGTIMDDKSIFKNFSTPTVTSFLTIERDRHLAPKRSFQLPGNIGYLNSALRRANTSGTNLNELISRRKENEQKVFSHLVGRSLVGESSSVLTGTLSNLRLRVSDDRDSSHLRLRFFSDNPFSAAQSSSPHSSALKSFHVHQAGRDHANYDSAMVLYGELVADSGRKINVVGEFNLNREEFNVGPVVLRGIVDGKMEVLFQAYYTNLPCKVPAMGSRGSACR